jgi:Xaa-Pro aminopeptidase
MHGVSHYLGLDVHDVGNKSDMLLPGMVITCEPALYIREESIGIRLENDILVTELGNINLTSQIPMLPDEIEEMLEKQIF